MKYLIITKKIWNKESVKYRKLKSKILNKLEFNLIEKLKPDRIYLIHWSKIIDERIFKRYDCIQFHCSNLPKFKGGSPVQNQIINGINKTKLTGFKVVKKIDSGDICFTRNINLNGNAEEIYKRIENMSFNAILGPLNKKKLNFVSQKGKSSFYTRRTPSESKITKEINNTKNLYDFIRMLDADTYPKAFLDIKNFKIELYNAKYKKKHIYGNFIIKKK